MAQKTFISEILTASDVNTFLMGEGGAWTSWTPTVTQTGAVTVTNTRSRFARYGRTIHFTTSLTVTGSGTAGAAITVSLPVTAAASLETIGQGFIFDSTANSNFPGMAFSLTTTTMVLRPTSISNVSGNLGTFDFTAGLAVSDVIVVSGTYEAAS